VVGVAFAVNGGDFVVGEKFVPTAAPNIVVTRVEWQGGGKNAGIIPEQARIEGLVSDLPDFGARRRKDEDAEETILKEYGGEATVGPAIIHFQIGHGTSSLSRTCGENGNSAGTNNGTGWRMEKGSSPQVLRVSIAGWHEKNKRILDIPSQIQTRVVGAAWGGYADARRKPQERRGLSKCRAEECE